MKAARVAASCMSLAAGIAGVCPIAERACDRGLDRALHTADLLIVGKRELTVSAEIGVETFQREGQKRHHVRVATETQAPARL
jgi:hypothetical protein